MQNPRGLHRNSLAKSDKRKEDLFVAVHTTRRCKHAPHVVKTTEPEHMGV